jgi:hypothetical protein
MASTWSPSSGSTRSTTCAFFAAVADSIETRAAGCASSCRSTAGSPNTPVPTSPMLAPGAIENDGAASASSAAPPRALAPDGPIQTLTGTLDDRMVSTSEASVA